MCTCLCVHACVCVCTNFSLREVVSRSLCEFGFVEVHVYVGTCCIVSMCERSIRDSGSYIYL